MFRFLLLAAVVTVGLSKDAKTPEPKTPDSKADEAASPVIIHNPYDEGYTYRDSDGQEDQRNDLHYGPVILRSIHPDNKGHPPNIPLQNKIIENVYSPDYYEPTWILDYRYMKTGGRDYTRGPGGQIIILPRNVRTKEEKEFSNYDELLEFLRMRNLAEHSKQVYEVRGRGGYEQQQRGGGYEQQQRGGGYEQQQRGGGYEQQQRGGGYEQQQRGGGYEQQQRGGGYEQQQAGRGQEQYGLRPNHGHYY